MINVAALILAGGEGTRFAPLSTPSLPKQFLNLVGDQSLIRQTVDRIRPVIPAVQCWVATNARYQSLVQEHLPEIAVDHIIGETQKKNTAPAIAWAAKQLYRLDPDAVMVVLPSDHVILDAENFRRVLQQAIQVAVATDVLVTLGIPPTWASTDYGYIAQGKAVGGGVYQVQRFVEKPDLATAARYLKEGTYTWNSGMFVWRASVLLDEVRQYLPQMHEMLARLRGDQIADYFEQVQSISIDYGVMEKSSRVVTIPAAIGWNDVGTWESLKTLVESGAVRVSAEVQQLIHRHAGSSCATF